MIFTNASVPVDTRYRLGAFSEFAAWVNDLDEFQLDVETNVADSVIEQKLRTIQFGEFNPSKPVPEKTQWVLEWRKLKKEEKIFVLKIIQRKYVRKYILNVVFEYGIFLNYGVVLENCCDPMLREKILYTGHSHVLDEEGATFFSLEGISRRRLFYDLDKTYQTLFGFENPLTPGHIVYAAQDVQELDVIYQLQEAELDIHYPTPKHLRTVENYLPMLEDEAALAFGDIMWNGMKLDKEKWLQNAAEAQPIVDKYKANLEEYLHNDPILNKKAIELGYLSHEDRIQINWNSPVQKLQLYQYAFPDLPGATRPIIKKYIKDQIKEDPNYSNSAACEILTALSEGNPSPLFNMLMEYCREDLIKMGYVIPPGTITINWNAWQQTLPLLQAIKKSLNSTSEETLNKLGHPIAFAMLDYRGALKLTTAYGEKFIEKCDPDGKIRTRINQILETGRISSSDPNLQQVPIVEDDDPVVANKYRNCFMPDSEDEVFVSSDFSSQELTVIASLSQDPVWMEALHKGHDLHSICAELVYGKEWTEGIMDNCVFVKERQKCKCPAHKRMRNAVKTINFGLAYGMSQFKLSATLKIEVKEAEKLIEKYFKTFPKIGGKLRNLGHFAIKNGFILTLKPYFRKRFYPLWPQVKSKVEYHIAGIEHNALLGSIERTGKNTPIQGCSADMMKLALCYIRRYINDNNLRRKVRIVMQVHDQCDTIAKLDFAEEWKGILTELMESAAKVIIPSGLLKADTQITARWSK